jgi:glucose/arabinose dehydrogenase
MKLSSYASIIAFYIMAITPAAAAPIIERIGAPLVHPWGMDFLDDSHILVTERGGDLYKINLSDGTRQAIAGLPQIEARRQGGLLDIAVLTQEDSPHSVFFCYSKPVADGTITAIDKAQLTGTSLTNRKTIFAANQTSRKAIHYGCRLVLDDGYIYASLGERGRRHDAQDPSLHVGDEINIISAGANYGWPKVSHGKEYIGGSIGIGTSAPGLTDPAWVWTPSIAPSGMAFYQGTMFPQFDGHLLVGSLKFERLYLLHITDGLPQAEAVILEDAIGRVRDVAVAADGSILLLSDETDGGLYRLTEAGQ